MNFAERLRELRKSRRLSQGDIADLLGVTRQAVSAYERGTREPDYESLEVLADYFNVDMDYLMGRTSKTTRIAVPTSGQDESYYLDDEAREMLRFLNENPEYKVLLSSSRKLKPEDLEIIKAMIERMS